MLTTSRFTHAITETSLKKVFVIGYKEVSPIYPRVFNVDNARFLSEKTLTTESTPLLAEGGEGTNVHTFDINEAYKTTYTQRVFDGGFYVTLQMRIFDMYGLIAKFTKDIGRAAAETTDYYAADYFNNCTATTAAYVLADGKALIDTAHPLVGGSTFSNKPTTDVDIDVAPLEDALFYYDTIPDHNGNPTQAKEPGLIIVNPKLKPRVLQLLTAEKVPFEQSNTPNIIKTGWNIDVAFWKWISGTDDWFLLPKRIDYNRMFWGYKPNIEVTYKGETRNQLVTCVSMFKQGFDDPRDVYGSTGTA